MTNPITVLAPIKLAAGKTEAELLAASDRFQREFANEQPGLIRRELVRKSEGELYRELESSGANQLYIDGGKTIQGFLSAGLIHEIIITRIPILIGSGISLFGHLAKDQKLRHVETLSFKNGFVQSKYKVL